MGSSESVAVVNTTLSHIVENVTQVKCKQKTVT